MVASTANESEDCLTLSIYTPATHPTKEKGKGKGKPVLFWIHGGNLQSGTSGQEAFDGTSFVTNHGIVVVTVNYRLGGMLTLISTLSTPRRAL